MIPRYSRPAMAALWEPKHKFDTWLEVEIAATEAWEKLGKVPEGTAARMRANARFTVERIDELEASTHHDVVAFTRCVAESLGEDSKWLHYGLTSTDVVDTAQAAILREACGMLVAGVEKFNAAVDNMNAKLRDSIQIIATKLAEEENMTPELGVRLMGDLCTTLAESYDEIGLCVGEDRRGEISSLELHNFVDPSVAEPLISVQGKLGGFGMGPGGNQ